MVSGQKLETQAMKNALAESHISLRTASLFEVLSVIVTVLIAVWIVVPLYPGNRLLIGLVAAGGLGLMIHSHRVRGEGVRELGFTSEHFWSAVRLLAAPTIGAMLLLFWIGYQYDGLRIDDNIWRKALFLPLWGTLQQYILQGFIYRRMRTLTERRELAIVAAASLFALVHLPNPTLTVLTLVGGLYWTWVYERAPNLYAIGLSHGILSLTAMSTLPRWLLESLSVGFKHFLYQTF